MPGMNSGLNINDPTVVAAFKTALVHQGLIALAIFAVVGLGWVGLRAWLPGTEARQASARQTPEPAWRLVLRIGFGIIWLFDGILQAQPKMAVGLPSQVIEPTAASSARWVQDVVNWAGTNWSYHPMQAGAAAVWIQVGIGVWLLTAARGPLSRLAGVVSVGWGLVVWVFGEAFGGIFAPGLTWLFGAPGAVLIYCVAGALIALPERAWHSRLPGRLTMAGLGVFLVGMAVLQAWPGRGFWQGEVHGQPGSLASMTSSMAPTPQPHVFTAWINAFTAFDEAHGFAVNLFAVIALAITGVVFLTCRRRLILPVLAGFVVLCLADWLLIEDFGFFGGLGTDPNSMVPFALLATAGYLALSPAPQPELAVQPAEQPAAHPVGRLQAVRPGALLARLQDAARPGALASASISSVAALGAIGVIILGAAPMAVAQANPVADTILAQAIDGNNAPLNFAASPFSLTDQYGHTVTLASLRGKVVLLTFLDPVCTSDCPLIAQEFKQAAQQLSGEASHVELVAIVANPVEYQIGYTRAFDRQEGLTGVRNWLYLTGTLPQLQQVWRNYAIAADIEPAGAMIGHSEVAYVVNADGIVRQEMSFDPGPGTAATRSSFAAELTDAARQLLGQS
jgi:cytochrome oxidase Cu insertion factor (SCO1/SenC/PrrC family)